MLYEVITVFARDAETGLKAIIAVHDAHLGPALGGCRISPVITSYSIHYTKLYEA